MDITAVSVICITAAIMCKLVEKDGREFSIVISLAAGVSVILYILLYYIYVFHKVLKN